VRPLSLAPVNVLGTHHLEPGAPPLIGDDIGIANVNVEAATPDNCPRASFIKVNNEPSSLRERVVLVKLGRGETRSLVVGLRTSRIGDGEDSVGPRDLPFVFAMIAPPPDSP
jgi:hypothetical protein